MRRPIALLLAGVLLTTAAAGCSDEGDAGRPPTAEVVDCGLTNPSRGAASPFAQLEVTNAGEAAGRVRVVVRFLDGGTELGTGEAVTRELAPGGAAILNVTMAGTARAVEACEVAEADRR